MRVVCAFSPPGENGALAQTELKGKNAVGGSECHERRRKREGKMLG